jgi:hypothetical protein
MRVKVVYNRRNRLNAHGEALIEIEIYVSERNRKFRGTGISLKPIFWDEQSKCVRKNHPDHEFLNGKILLQKKEIENFLLGQKLQNEELDISLMENSRKEKTKMFFDFFSFVMEVSNVELTNGTKKIYKRTLKYLKEYSDDIRNIVNE